MGTPRTKVQRADNAEFIMWGLRFTMVEKHRLGGSWPKSGAWRPRPRGHPDLEVRPTKTGPSPRGRVGHGGRHFLRIQRERVRKDHLEPPPGAQIKVAPAAAEDHRYGGRGHGAADS